MKIIIDTDKKEIILIGLVTLNEINTFIKERNLEDYSISVTDTSTHWYRGRQIDPVTPPINPLDPPYNITCTGGPITVTPGSTSATVSHIDQILDAPKVDGFMDEAIKVGYRLIDPNKYRAEHYWEQIDKAALDRLQKSTIHENDPLDGIQ